jgi:hypothetical protein
LAMELPQNIMSAKGSSKPQGMRVPTSIETMMSVPTRTSSQRGRDRNEICVWVPGDRHTTFDVAVEWTTTQFHRQSRARHFDTSGTFKLPEGMTVTGRWLDLRVVISSIE